MRNVLGNIADGYHQDVHKLSLLFLLPSRFSRINS